MKKILFTLLFVLIALISNAQIYNTIKYYDKFDDCIKTEKVKTFINCNVRENEYKIADGAITIETKGKKLKTYYPLMAIHYGNKDSLSNLVADVYGYQIDYICIEEKDTATFNQYIWANDIGINFLAKKETIDSLKTIGEYNDMILNYTKINVVRYPKEDLKTVTLTHRVISKYHYYFSYDCDLFWIKKNDGSRIIYSNEK